MKVDSIAIKNHPPVKNFDVVGLSDIVVLAGPNGVGKSRLVSRLLAFFQSPSVQPDIKVSVSATCDEERTQWGQSTLDTSVQQHAQKLAATLQRNQKRGRWKSSAIYFDSSRQFAQLQPLQWSWQFVDPMEEAVGWNLTYQPFLGRYQDTIHSIYRLLGHHRSSIAKRAIDLQKSGQQQMPLDFPDPLQKFKDTFNLLLAPKTLADVDITNPRLEYVTDGQTLSIETLSSGEKEVLSITFDLLLRNPEDCIIVFDEPELHLHPELSFRLLKTLQTVGQRNQFVLCTHSADIITSALDHSVVFVSRRAINGNQGILIRRADDNVVALQELGQSLGIISLGRKIVLIEGQERSIDRDTYGALIQGKFPGLVLAPSGSRQTILSFARVTQDVLNKTIWGIDFFMLADRDNSLPTEELARLRKESNDRLRFLPRYHIENYFLDEHTISESFGDLAPVDSWLRDPAKVRERLLELAKPCVPIAVNLSLGTQLRSIIGEVEVSAKDVQGKDLAGFKNAVSPRLAEETARISAHMDKGSIEALAEKRWEELEKALGDPNDAWKREFPGKILVNKFCAAASINRGHFQNLYLAAARRAGLAPFKDIIEIFAEFDQFKGATNGSS